MGNEAGTILNNPLDIPNLASASAVHEALTSLYQYDGIDMVVFHAPLRGMMVPVAATAPIFQAEADTIIRLNRDPVKPMAVVLHSQANTQGWDLCEKQARVFSEAGLPVYHSMTDAARAIERFMRWRDYLDARVPGSP